ncbi:hypothetical protein [Mesorhizobium sp. B2-6-6]
MSNDPDKEGPVFPQRMRGKARLSCERERAVSSSLRDLSASCW